MRSYILILFCIFTLQLSQEVHAQDSLTSKLFFDQIPVINSEATLPTKIKLPLIDNYEIRTRTNQFDLDRQQYTFRLTPSTIKRRNAQRAIYEHLSQKPNFNKQEYSYNLVKSLNEDWLKILYLKKRVELLDSLELNYQRKSYILNNKSQSLTYKEDDLVQVEIKNTDLLIEKYKHSNLLSNLLDQYSAIGVQDSFYSLLSTSEILSLLSSELNTNSTQLLAEDRYKSDLIQKEIDLEQAERKQLFDFLQLRYEGPETDELRERLSVGVAFKLNRTSQSKLKIEELKLEQQEIYTEMQWDEQEHRFRLKKLRENIVADIRFLNFYTSTIDQEHERLNTLQQSILLSTDFNPRLLLEIQERAIINQLDLLDLRYDIYSNYVDFIHRSGTQFGSAQVNWLD